MPRGGMQSYGNLMSAKAARDWSRQVKKGQMDAAHMKMVLEDPEYELFHNMWKKRRMLPPYDSLIYGYRLRNWSYFLLLCAIYEALWIPMQLAFQEPRGSDGVFRLSAVQLALQYLIDCCFLVRVH